MKDLQGIEIKEAPEEVGAAIALPKTVIKQLNLIKLLKMQENGEMDKLVKNGLAAKISCLSLFCEGNEKMNLDFSAITPSIPYILKGLEVTLKIVAVSALAGFILGTLLALCKIARIRALNIAADLYTSIFRGTPLVLQLMIIYFGVPQIIGYEIPAFLAAVLAFSLNSGAYMSEVIRAGIQAVDKGQTEAAMVLGIPYGKMMRNIIFLKH